MNASTPKRRRTSASESENEKLAEPLPAFSPVSFATQNSKPSQEEEGATDKQHFVVKIVLEMLEITAPLYRPNELLALLKTGEEMNIIDSSSICWTPYTVWTETILPRVRLLEWPHNGQPPSPTTVVDSREISWYVRNYTSQCKNEKYYAESSCQQHVESWLDFLISVKKVQELEKNLEVLYLRRTENVTEVPDAPIASTSTSSTIAIRPTDNADAPSSKISHLFSSLREKFSDPPTPSTSLTSSYISLRLDGKLQAFSLREPESEYLLHLRCWRLKDVKDVPQRDRYQHTYASVTLNMGEDSCVHQHVTHLVNAAANELMSKGGNYWERK
jgi:hypothetical protein